ncbi:DNA-directed RNA polymerase i subunit rpa2 [Anaeramoeba flamelloides]|uniref:DNA-directed RNA polymerase subunit beta n=1 Tax=Anaeramoeba flamelloides TaxID=1746091 RepID=A0AAV7YDW8_9EUKA|nr:DNA-directed RNA polymerase i subunit rpa2 [Anaeramoeba flamelloides]
MTTKIDENPFKTLVHAHVSSFNEAMSRVNDVVIDLIPEEYQIGENAPVRFWIRSLDIEKPRVVNNLIGDEPLYPSECRERNLSYTGKIVGEIVYQIGNGFTKVFQYDFGRIPIMVQSTLCNLHGMTKKQLIEHKEEETEAGGYFIIGGIERLIRLIFQQRRNHPLAIIRPVFEGKGPGYTKYATMIRCTHKDESSVRISLHYIKTGDVDCRISLQKRQFFVPIIILLKSLAEVSDKEIFDRLCEPFMKTNDKKSKHKLKKGIDSFITERIEMMLHTKHKYDLSTRSEYLAFLGSRFRVRMRLNKTITDEQAGREFIRRYILVHLDTDHSKFNLMIHMLHKLYALILGEISPDNPDTPSFQEVLLPGDLYLMYLRYQLQNWLNYQSVVMKKLLENSGDPDNVKLLYEDKFFQEALKKNKFSITQRFQYFLATGNVVHDGSLGLPQTTGFSIVAEKLNIFRYLSHFRAIHKGAYFVNMKTTEIRKLLPEYWGFVCPIHTPDGTPCGLLNHFAQTCQIVTNLKYEDKMLITTLRKLISEIEGVIPIDPYLIKDKEVLPIFLNGCLINRCYQNQLESISAQLRWLKINSKLGVPNNLEIVSIPRTLGDIFPGLFLFTNHSRMIRPVLNLRFNKVEFIGTMEQMYLSVAAKRKEIVEKQTTHLELEQQNILSLIASLTPFSDFNQSPRNMYQCQMGKQTMGTPSLTWPTRSDNKMYRLISPQLPLVRNKNYLKFGMQNFPQGTNAMIAVISYTGYDMEDAMIINRASWQRGFAHGCIYKEMVIDLGEKSGGKRPKTFKQCQFVFQNYLPSEPEEKINQRLGLDGLPEIGDFIKHGDPLYSRYSLKENRVIVERHKGEDCYIDQIRILSLDYEDKYVELMANTIGSLQCTKVSMKIRIVRNPVVGDKFSSRHGQKGVLSQLWPEENMPFTQDGLRPDVIINPHAFPSRMTIGMLIEAMAGKVASMDGKVQDGTTFQFSEKDRAIDFFGKKLRKAGYNYYGSETLYSGISGEPLHSDIFFGMVYYQRLRHMVGDKYQVRSTGKINNLTHQPVKGRKVGGGIRFGEMERDSLLAHGASFFLQDRLLNSSDVHLSYACKKCSTILSVIPSVKPSMSGNNYENLAKCSICGEKKNVIKIQIPYVFRYLVTELMAMNIKLSLLFDDFKKN